MDKLLAQITIAVNDELMKHNALTHQIEYLKKRANLQLFKPATGELRTNQLNNLEFVVSIIDTLQKEDFHPFLFSGSLLGAVRHKGFVPWDDDIDFALMADEFWRLRDFIKNTYKWVDSSACGKTLSYWTFLDNAFKQNPNQTFGMQTPYCLHLYKGTCLEDCVNIEFLPYYYFKDSVSETDYKNHQNIIHRLIHNAPNYGVVFNFYDTLLKDYSLTYSDSNKIAAGINHNSLTELGYIGFFEKSTFFPLQEIEFEGCKLPTLNDPHTYLSKVYGDYMSLPSDVGISPIYSDMNRYLSSNGRKLQFPEASIF
jgi:lipopolysaccharide cholinephosphotransferase